MAEAKRKLAAILAADVANYSRLMGADEEGTVVALDACRGIFKQSIESHDGVVVDTAGDSVLATFDSVVQAVRCSVEVQKALAARNAELSEDQRMRFRIGVNLGDVIAKDDGTIYGDGVNVAARLESLAEPGGIMISETVRMQVRSQVDVGIADAGEHEVKNIAEPVHAYRIELDSPAAQLRKPRKFSAARIGIVWAILLIAVVVGSKFFPDVGSEDPVLTLPDGPAIAVLPFANLSADPEQDYFATGITEDLITKLSRFPTFFVIARQSTNRYKGKDVDVRDVGRDLGVRYVVVGSVRKGGSTVRVAVQVLDAIDGKQLWGESFDRELTAANLFQIQDEITSQVASIVADSYGIVIRAAGAASSSKPTNSLSAVECVMRRPTYYDVFTAEFHKAMRECSEQAVERDPDWAPAWITLALTYLDEFKFGFNPQPRPLERAMDAAKQAVSLDKENDLAQLVIASIHFHRHELDLFYLHAERAFEINPNNSTTLADLGDNFIFAGEIERGYESIRRAAALNPMHPGWYYYGLSEYHYRKGEYETALAMAQKINIPEHFWTQVHLARAYGQLNRKAEAWRSIEKLLELRPGYLQDGRQNLEDYNYPDAEIEHTFEGLRKAGLDIDDK